VAWLWLVVGIALAIAEAFSATFVLIMLSAGAFAAAAAAALGLPLAVQILAFGVVSVASLALVRPVIQRHLHKDAESDGRAIGLAAIEGSSGLVLERIDLDHGLIKVEGEVWTARPYDATQVFDKGERVRVIEIKGATALVWRE
jgi:membrane protein implicated in regulation of membrane protease activity